MTPYYDDGQAVRWDPLWNDLADYNSEKSRAAGFMYHINASPSERLATRHAAQILLNSLSSEYDARMEVLQRDYDERHDS